MGSGAQASVPYPDAYTDGLTWVFWHEPTDSELDSMLDRIRMSGTRHIQIPYFGCQSAIESADVGSCGVDLKPGPVALARRALAKGFSASFLPIVVTPRWEWRGFFDPSDVGEWFRTYEAWIGQVADQARELGMKELVVSTEMTQIYRHEAYWKALMTRLRARFPGALVITTNWDDVKHEFWAESDAIGVSAYSPLSDKPNPTQAELDAAWRAKREELLRLSRKFNRPVHITEVGYQSVSSAAKTPWAAEPGAVSDFALQARCFDAFRKAWQGERELVRANVWATAAEDPLSVAFKTSFETLGKPAETVLRGFFRNRERLKGFRHGNR